jgi:hypothetical protein
VRAPVRPVLAGAAAGREPREAGSGRAGAAAPGGPFLLGRRPVFLAGAGLPAAGDEGAVGFDGFGGVDRLVAHRGADVAVTADDLGDVRRQPVDDRVGDEDPAKIMRGEDQRLGVVIPDAGAGQRPLEDLAQRPVADGPVLTEDGALEQQRQGRVPGFLVGVVAGHQRDDAGAVADPADDRAKDVSELGADQEQPFGAGLGQRDLQQRDQLAGGGQPVLGDAVVAELAEFFEPDAFSRGRQPVARRCTRCFAESFCNRSPWVWYSLSLLL